MKKHKVLIHKIKEYVDRKRRKMTYKIDNRKYVMDTHANVSICKPLGVTPFFLVELL